LGCFGAIFQKSIKRLLAYSSINNVGYILAALSTGTISGIQAALVYIFFYILALILLFSLLLSKPGSNSISYVTDFNRLGTNPLIAIITTLCLFSLAGVPPLSGFLTKFFVLSELFNSKFYVLAIIGAFSSIISSFYYLSLIKLIYFEDKKPQLKVFKPGVPQALLVILSSSLVFFPLFPELVYTISGNIACGLI
jgi:NADH-quinone oxidoreductase subunit N